MNTEFRLAAPNVERVDLADGSILLRNRTSLPDPLPDVLDRFDQWVALDAESVLLTDRLNGENRSLSYGAAAARSNRIAARLAELDITKGDVVAVVGGAGVEHAIMKIACLKVGAVIAPFSPALIASPTGQQKLMAMHAIANPKATLFVDAGKERLTERGIELGTRLLDCHELFDPSGKEPSSGSINELRFLRGTFTPTDPAAIYFTSGSTGEPKGVSITRGMIASNQCAYALHWPFLARRRPVLIDWLPWHHVFGSLDNFFKMLWHGGEYHVDSPPDPRSTDSMAERIRTVRPSLHINVPFGIGLLLDRLNSDPATREAFFSQMELIFFAGAGMDSETWSRLSIAVEQAPARPWEPPTVLSGYGATEAASTICLGHEAAGRTGEIGLPIPGHELRLVPVDESFEVRVRGPNVAPAYIEATGIQPMSLDSEGFLCTGDTVTAVHEGEPERGLCFDGRIAEDFKLNNGTRVKVGALRHRLLETCAPYLADVAIAGEGQAYVSAILFESGAARAPTVRKDLAAHFGRALSRHNEILPGSSTAIRRAVIADRPPDPDAGEINDKGHLVQRRCLRNRGELVLRLYEDPPPKDVFLPDHPDSRIQRSNSNA